MSVQLKLLLFVFGLPFLFIIHFSIIFYHFYQEDSSATIWSYL